MKNNFQSARTVVFVHIPKTAGTSFTRYLETGLAGAAACRIPGLAAKKELVCTHEHLRIVHTRVNNGYFATFLRDPIARTISQYRSLRNPANYQADWQHELSKKQIAALEFCQTATFSEFINCTDESVFGHFVNAQTRMLSDYEIELADLMRQDLPKKAILASACHNLIEKINFVGIYEMVFASLAMFSAETSVDGSVCHLNQSILYNTNLSGAEFARLCNLLDLDLQLYAYALKVFTTRMRGWLEDQASVVKSDHDTRAIPE